MKNPNEYELADFLADESFQNWVKSNSQDEYWTNWFDENPTNTAVAEEARQILNGVSVKKESVAEEQINNSWNALQDQLEENGKEVVMEPEVQSPATSTNWIKFAAAIALLMVVSFLFYQNQEPELLSLNAAYGERNRAILNDGSKVTLNSNSQIKISDADETYGSVEVWLESGEAFFEVTSKNSENDERFVVHSGDLDITVLGTEFNVYNRRGVVRINLIEGKVDLKSKSGESSTMNPGDQYVYQVSDQRLELESSDKSIAWINNEIVFDESTLEEITIVLEDRFGIEFQIDSEELKERKLTGRLPDEDLDVILEAIKSSLDVEITRQGKAINIL